MKKKFNLFLHLIFTLLFLFNFQNKSYSESAMGPRCYDLFDQIRSEWKEKELYLGEVEQFIDYGFEAEIEYNIVEKSVVRNKTKHLIVGVINDPSLIGKVKVGDVIISVGDIDTSTVSDEDDYSFFEKTGNFAWYSYSDGAVYSENEITEKKGVKIAIDSGLEVEWIEIAEVKFSRNGKEFKLQLPKLERTKLDEPIFTKIKNISNVDIKSSTFTVKLSTLIDNTVDSAESYPEEDREDAPMLGSIILENLIFKDEEGEWKYTACNNLNLEMIENLRIPFPGDNVFIKNTTSLNQNLINSFVNIEPWSKRVGDDTDNDYAKIATQTNGTYIIQNDFKLQTFPFDKQVLKIAYLSTNDIDDYEMTNKWNTYSAMNYFIKNQKINGWDIEGFNLYNTIEESEIRNMFVSTAVIEIQIERQHGYYIYKVLIPILLILLVCWSVVWVDPKELEARLTITIVCLLSLIAYNFVIDSELPKLEYLTVMDWIILVSYFYATVPNFISIISFRLYKKDRRLSDKIEFYSKRYGASSYIVSILVIILINANLNPENSSALISWMAGK
jgi:hypothetical protein